MIFFDIILLVIFMMMDAICAIATSYGSGAISIVRASGKDSIKMINEIFKGPDLTKVASHTISYGSIVYKGEIIEIGYVLNGWGSIWHEGDFGYINTSNKYIEIL